MPRPKSCDRIAEFGTGRGHPRLPPARLDDPSTEVLRRDYSKIVPLSVRQRTERIAAERRNAVLLTLAWFGVCWALWYLVTQ